LEPQFSEQEVLVDLGLTQKQARVYLALAKFGPLRIMEISRISKIVRPDVYPSLEKLQRLGVVEKLIKTPPEYRAIPMNQALSSLLEAKTNQYERVRVATEHLRGAVKTEKPDALDELESNQFVLIPEGKVVVDRIRNAIEKAQKNIDLILSWKRASRGLADLFADSLKMAWANNVRFRLIAERPPKSQQAEELVQSFREKPMSQMRFIPYHPETVLGIYDKKHVFIIIISQSDLQSSPALWSNNDALISLAANYFELLWLSASESMS
jgi:sugar-specific transcriptional regulator TrmB